MTIDRMIEAHQEIIARLKGLQENLLTATDGTLCLKETISRLMATGKEWNVRLEIDGDAKGNPPEIQWRVQTGRSWSPENKGDGPTLADAYRKFATPDAEATVDKVQEELTGQPIQPPESV